MSSLIRFTPRRDLFEMQREIDRMFNNVFPAVKENDSEMETAVWMPRVDLAENDTEYMIHVDVPGLSRDELNIDLHEGVLTISGERKFEEKEENKNFVRVERKFGHFRRSFTLPSKVKEDKIQAKYHNGVLDIQVPKADEVKPRKIEIS